MFDTHTHCYPDKIGPKVADYISATYEGKIPLSGDFTLSDNLAYMDRCGVNSIVTFCVADSPRVVTSANNFIIQANDNRKIFGFGTIDPDMDSPVEEVVRLHEAGIKGIKFHSLFQSLSAADKSLIPIFKKMAKLGMIAYFHVGRDPGDPEQPAKTSSESIFKLNQKIPNLIIVAAHLGGYLTLDKSVKWLLGQNVYIDTSWAPNICVLEPDQVTTMIKQHGVNKVLFGSDYPTTTDPAPQISWLKQLDFNSDEKELIFNKNAKRLLSLE